MLSDFLAFSLSALEKSVNYNTFAFIVIPVGVICLFALIIRLIRRVY